MRTNAAGLLGIIGMALLAGCSSSSDDTNAPTNPTSVAQAKSSLSRDEAPTVADADKTTLANDNQAFALSAYGAIAKQDATANLFFSPYSISSALAMTYAGAKGQTATEMATALHFSLPQERLHPAFDAVDLSLTKTAPASADGSTPFTLHVANSLWGYTKETFQQPFLDTLATNYGAAVNLEDFLNDPKGSETKINDWVAAETNNKILNLLNGAVTSDTRLVLVDAIYFDADWRTPFAAESTSSGTFNAVSGAISTSMMHLGDTSFSATHTDAYDAVELPYQGTSVMDIVMPKAGTLGAFESTLTGASLATIVTGLTAQPVDLTLPKFSYEGGTISLKPILQGLGMNVAFTNSADFTGIATDPDGLRISDVLHKAFLRVDEKGTEAAAATAVVVGTDSAVQLNPPQPLVITVDHPFFFTIRDTATNTILFTGRINDPTK